MKTLFENKYTRNKEWAKDLYCYIFFKRPIMIILSLAFFANFVYQIYNAITHKGFEWSLAIIVFLWFGYIAILYAKSVKSVIKRDLEVHSKPIETTVIVTDESIKQSTSTGSEIVLNYSDIKKVAKTKKYIYLISKTNMYYTLKRDSFSVGDEKEIIDFLKNKADI